jgi:hypothetical protein
VRNKIILLLLLTLFWFHSFSFIAPTAPAAQARDQDFEGLEDDLLVLTKLGEQVTLQQLSLKSFRCQERVRVTEIDKATKVTRQKEFVNPYEVIRKPDKRVNEQLLFTETRSSSSLKDDPNQNPPWEFPTIENPFTGYVLQMFSFENRLASDFKKVREEKVEGRDCVVFAFETVPEMSATKILILGRTVALRQRGLVWVDAGTNHLIRLTAKQLRLPQGCRAYELQMDFVTRSIFGQKLSLPAHAELKVDLKQKSYQVEQDYGEFQPL